MSRWIPDRKLLATGVAGVVAFYLIGFAKTKGIELPIGQQDLAILIGLVMGYIVPPSQRDIVKRLNDQLVQIARDDPAIPVK